MLVTTCPEETCQSYPVYWRSIPSVIYRIGRARQQDTPLSSGQTSALLKQLFAQLSTGFRREIREGNIQYRFCARKSFLCILVGGAGVGDEYAGGEFRVTAELNGELH